MTIYVDDFAYRQDGKIWFHLMTDHLDNEELHQFATKVLGLQRHWFRGDHYDITKQKRDLALKRGVLEISTSAMIHIHAYKRKQRRLASDSRQQSIFHH